jgi:hypothetical protein
VLDALAGQEFAASPVPTDGLWPAALPDATQPLPQIGSQLQVVFTIGAVLRARRIDARFEHRHRRILRFVP